MSRPNPLTDELTPEAKEYLAEVFERLRMRMEGSWRRKDWWNDWEHDPNAWSRW